MVAWWLVVAVILVIFKVYQKVTCGKCTSDARLDGKVVIVTGANCGIGFATAEELARRGARVVLACRSDARGRDARDRIVRATGNREVVYSRLDMASLESVRAFAARFVAAEKRLDVLLNNAAAAGLGQRYTADGIVAEMQINHFAPFLLTTLLLPLLRSSAPSRIINVSSLGHILGTGDLEKLNTPNHFNDFKLYCNAKLCNVLFARELSRRLAGSGVTAASLHPGAVSSGIFRNAVAPVRFAAATFNWIMFKSEREGSQTSVHLVVSPDGGSGEYFADCARARASRRAGDPALAERLWRISAALVGLEEGLSPATKQP